MIAGYPWVNKLPLRFFLVRTRPIGHGFAHPEKFSLNFQVRRLKSVSIFSILVSLWFIFIFSRFSILIN